MKPIEIRTTTIALLLILGLVVFGLWGCPRYKVYSQRLEGEAELARASYNRQVKVTEANATMESSTLLAKADSMRAIGVAASNRIIAASITQQYIEWKWVDEAKSSSQIIYVPSGNLGIPILEASRLQKPAQVTIQQP